MPVQVKPQYLLIEIDLLLQISHVECDLSDACGWMNGEVHLIRGVGFGFKMHGLASFGTANHNMTNIVLLYCFCHGGFKRVE